MEYVIVFLEGIAAFISPCLLPMIPLYISYFAGRNGGNSKKQALINSIGFVLGFTILFVLLGVFAGTFGRLINTHMKVINIILGIIIILFGLNYMGLVRIPILNKTLQIAKNKEKFNFFSAVLFGIVFSIGWTPCVGAFLGSALMLVTTYGEITKGVIMLLLFSLGLGIPFIISSVLLEKLKTTFDWIKKHYKQINIICGIGLVIIGILMMFGINNIILR